jgi:glutathione S-transferase
MIMKLYYAPGACSLSPHIALREAGLPFDLVKVSFPAKTTQAGDDFTAINPKGAVPALKLDDGELLTEGTAIVQYVADKAPTSKLAPAAGSKEHYRLVEWLNYVATELHKGFAPLWKPDTPAEYKETVKKSLSNQFAFLDKELASRKFLMGDRFTVADGYLFTILNWANFHKIDLAPYANVTAFIARVTARPAVQEALKAEGLLKAA